MDMELKSYEIFGKNLSAKTLQRGLRNGITSDPTWEAVYLFFIINICVLKSLSLKHIKSAMTC